MSTPPTQYRIGLLHRRLSLADLWQAVNRRSGLHWREAPAVVGSPLLPCLHRLPPHQRRQPRLPAPPPHCEQAAALPQELWEQALAGTMLEGDEPQAHREVQGGPSPPLRRLARALRASCLTMTRCARAAARLLFHRCRLLRIRWQALKRRSRIQEYGDEYLELDTRPARRCAYPMSLAPSRGTPGSSTR